MINLSMKFSSVLLSISSLQRILNILKMEADLKDPLVHPDGLQIMTKSFKFVLLH